MLTNQLLLNSILRRSIITCTLFALGAFVTATAQTRSTTDGSTPLALSPGAPSGAYSLNGFDNVNLFNGNLNFRLPLLHVGGRGNAQYAMMLPIEQHWRVLHRSTDFQEIELPSSNAWLDRPGYSPGKLEGRTGAVDAGFGPTCGPVQTTYIQTLTRFTFTLPDGTEYELRDQLTGGQPQLSRCSSGQGFARGTVFITADGTAATFISDTTIYDLLGSGTVYPSGYLMLRDGTRYRIDSENVTWIRDRNGNKLSFTYGQYGVASITDSLNRQISITHADLQTTFADVITFKGFGGATRTITINYNTLSTLLRTNRPGDFAAVQTPAALFPQLNGSSSSTSNPYLISSVVLPDGVHQYQFKYNAYGELARATLPTGGAYEYDFGNGILNDVASGVMSSSLPPEIYRRVLQRRVYPDGSTLEGITNYSRPESTTGTTAYVEVDYLKPDGTTLITADRHYFSGVGSGSLGMTPTGYAGWQDGKETQTDAVDSNGSTILRTVANTWQQGVIVSSWNTSIPNNPRISDTTTTVKDVSPNLVSKQSFLYDDALPYNNQNDVKEYDWGNGAVGSLARETRITYVQAINYTDASSGAHLRSLPSQVSTYDASGVERARTTFEYDNYNADTNHAGLWPRSAISGFDSSFSTSYTTRGNVTGTTRYLLTNGSVTGSVSGYAQYDMAGNVVKAIDARGNATNIDFTDRFGSPDGEATSNTSPTELISVGQAGYALPTLVTNAANQTAYSQFDYYTGKVVDGQDANSVVSSGYYNDSLDRPTQVVRAANQGTSVKSQTAFSYDDTNRTITTTSDQSTYGDNALKSQTLYDGLGRTTEARQYEGGTNYIGVQTQYDALGRAYKTSNPFRPWNSESAIWTTSGFDALSRITSLTTPDSAVVTTSYSGNTVTVTDQNSKARKSISDALGRLTSVYEDPNGLAYQTSYSYDVLDDLTTVTQSSQTRTFVYDSLKRLTSAANPENGTVNYQYDNNGNLTQKTDPRTTGGLNWTTTIGYDALNRPTSKTYQNDGGITPAVTYSYDTATNGKGRLASVTSSVSSYNYSGYDALGRVLGGSQIIGAQTYSLSYIYDLAGHVTGMTYPSGRTVSYGYDSAGRTSSFSGYLGDGTNRTYATGLVYSPLGGITKEQFGTTTPIYNKLFYNSRGQLSEIRESTSYTGPTDTTWDRGAIINHYSNNCWGMCGGSNSTNAMTDNNGNLKKQEVYIPGSDTFAQFYDYDSLNRVQAARENKNGGAVNWQQQYVYDRYGNRTVDQTNTWGTGIPKPNFGVDTTTNRLTAPAGYTMSYDAVGNLTTDTYTGQGTRTFDAENRTKQAWANSQWQTYTYDGDGRRVKRNVNGTETWQVYGMASELVAEYAANASPSSPQKEYGYRNGQMLVTAEPSANIHYLVTDQLGTPRMIFDQSGSLANVSRHDYLPFGEELFAGVGGRLTTQGYTGDGARQKFTSYEADSETGLNFAQARYHSSAQGRFSSVDPLMMTDPYDPQSLNGYSYVGNNPLNFVDPSGMVAQQDRQRSNDPFLQLDPNEKLDVVIVNVNFWQRNGRPLTEDELAQNRPLRSLTEGRLASQGGNERAISGALNIAGAVGTFGSSYMYQEGAFWRDIRGVANTPLNTKMFGQGPNQYTGARSIAIQKAGALTRLGQAAGIAGYSLSGIRTVQALRSGGVQAGIKPGIDTIFGIAGTHGGLWGASAAGIYFGVDMTIGWERMAGCDAQCQIRANQYGMFAK